MEYIDGIPIDDKESLLAQEYDLNEIGLKLADHYVKQVVEDGFFQADPHPGNLRIRDGKIIWIDLGMMGRLSARDQELLRRGIKAVVRGAELQNGVLWLRDTGRKSASLPSQLSDLLGQSSKGRLKMNVRLVDTEFPLSQMERMTNRRILCAFAIALLIGACLLCLAELTPAWGGVPVLSWIGLAASLLLALWVVWDMHRSRKGKP